MGLISRFKNSWNAFINKDENKIIKGNYEVGSYYKPDRIRVTRGNDRSIVTAILNRVSMDASAIDIRHCRLDDNGRFVEEINSGLNNCLSLEANIDQTSKSFMQDVVMSLLNEGVVAIVPVDTSVNPNNNSYDILTMRTGKITEWFPSKVKVQLYNDLTGKNEELILDKTKIGIIENPWYSVMNEPNSTLQRLMRKLALLDAVDEKTNAGKLDIIIQLPYTVKHELRRNQAEQRRKDIEDQLTGSRYGIAYIDGTEKVTQLNRPIENNLMSQIEYLTSMLYSQLGITDTVLNGTASSDVMNNYYSRTINPIVKAITDEMIRKFLTKTARTQKQTIMSFRDPFKLIPVSEISKIADTFTRNEILSSNEIRQIIGFKPSSDPAADELRNSNLNKPNSNFYPEMSETNKQFGSDPLRQYKNYREQDGNNENELNKEEV